MLNALATTFVADAVIFAVVCGWALWADRSISVFDRGVAAPVYLASIWLVFALGSPLGTSKKPK